MKNRYLAWILPICLFLSACSEPAETPTSPVEPSASIDSAQVQAAIDSAAAYLATQVNEDGSFIYRVNMNPNVKLEERYNILRHAGTIYSLTMYQSRYANPKVMEAIERSIHYLRTKAIAPLDKEGKVRAVWSIPSVNKTGAPLQAKLGGNGLGLVALLSYDKLRPDQIPLEELRSLGRFIVYMQKENGDFYSKFIPSEGGRNDEWVSLFYPGEAALGLVMLYEKDPDPLWLNAAAKAINYLAETRKNEDVVPEDHWALLATERLMRLQVKLPVSRNLLLHHSKQIITIMLSAQIYAPSLAEIHGGFTTDGRTTPAATRLEGLLASHEFLPQALPIHAYVAAAAPLGIEFLLNAQVQEGAFRGAYPRSTRMLAGTSPEAAAANARATEVRIDYVQHALSALIQYQDILSLQ